MRDLQTLSEAAGRGRLRPAQPTSCRDLHDFIEAAAARRNGLKDASTAGSRPTQNFFGYSKRLLSAVLTSLEGDWAR